MYISTIKFHLKPCLDMNRWQREDLTALENHLLSLNNPIKSLFRVTITLSAPYSKFPVYIQC